MIVLIQDSQGTSSSTVESIKTVVRAMLRRLSSESTDFNFAVAKYATSRRMSCFGSAQETINYINKKYQHRGSGHNLLKSALSKMVLKHFEQRPGDRKTDTAKVRFTFVYFLIWSKMCHRQIQVICHFTCICFTTKLIKRTMMIRGEFYKTLTSVI